jgi:Protein of unknown function (DUF3379)
MMGCAEYRRTILTDPQHPTDAMRAHVVSCHDCTRYTERLLRFEGRLDRALRVPLGEGIQVDPRRSAPRPARPARLRRGWLAIAASGLIAVIAGGLWLALPRPGLAAAVVDHMAGEPQAWARTNVAVPEPQLAAVLRESRVRLKSSAGLVSYASSCSFRGHQVPHLVVQSAEGPVTVMVLTHEGLNSPVRFDEQGYRGVIVPVRDHGSLAVLERGPNSDMKTVESVAAQVIGAIDWTS